MGDGRAQNSGTRPRRRGQVFISFKTEEREYAFELKKVLEKRGYEVWWHEKLYCGGVWKPDIDKEIAASSCVIVLWSPLAASSEWVKHEASQALGRGVYAPARIIPVTVPSLFSDYQVIDLDVEP